MKSPEAKAALLAFLDRMPAAKRKELSAVTPEALGMGHLLHVSRDNNIRRFEPGVTRRTAPGEDHTIPRISTATTWAGCVLGYQSDVNDYLNQPVTKAADGRKVAFKGGWVVYGLPFEYALRPSVALVPDAPRTGEHWLVTYDNMTVDYRPFLIAKVFYEDYSIRAGGDGARVSTITAVFEVLENQSLAMGGGLSLSSGYWRLVFNDLHASNTYGTVNIISCDRITETDYQMAKGAVASLLSMDVPTPASQCW